MIPKERAEKIALHLNLDPKASWVAKYLPDVAAEIRAAVEDEGYTVANDLMEHYDKLIKQRIAEAYEDAAKIADSCSKAKVCCVDIASAIRARAKECAKP